LYDKFGETYQEKDSVFECGFHSFLGQNRTQFNISFFIFGLLFLLFDLEILLVYPYSVSSYTNDAYGLIIMMLFFVLLTLGFIFELGKNALSIDSKQTSLFSNKNKSNIYIFTDTLKSETPFNFIFVFVAKALKKKIGSSTRRRSYIFFLWSPSFRGWLSHSTSNWLFIFKFCK
jgi:NADH-ubiquinone oxidoreductase chain 3